MEKSKRPVRDTMSSVVIKATFQMLASTGESIASFATERLIPALEIQGLIDVGTEGVNLQEYIRWRNRSIKRAQRVMTGETPLPADWIITWISVLPEEFRNKSSQKLAAMQGLQWVRLPHYNLIRAESVEAEIDAITVKFGDVLAHSAPAQDGFYDSSDDTFAVKHLQNRLTELMAYLKREVMNIEIATGIAPDYLDISNLSPLVVAGSVHAPA